MKWIEMLLIYFYTLNSLFTRFFFTRFRNNTVKNFLEKKLLIRIILLFSTCTSLARQFSWRKFWLLVFGYSKTKYITGLQLASELENHFLVHDPDVERSTKFKRDLSSCMARYQELYNDLTKTKTQKLITEFFAQNNKSPEVSSDESDIVVFIIYLGTYLLFSHLDCIFFYTVFFLHGLIRNVSTV